ncbi:unnamed protein product [Rhizophagus irregularis]|nr:unnamed protein product [Rhizophagus irregularis]
MVTNSAEEIVNEITLQRKVNFHKNIIHLYGITKVGNKNNLSKSYSLVMEYAEDGTLREYLKKNYYKLTWDNKFNLAFQLSYVVSCLHDEEIVHHDLHSNNILIHQDTLKLADLGLTRRIEKVFEGCRETPVLNAPKDYVKIYSDCWNGDPDKRPTIKELK